MALRDALLLSDLPELLAAIEAGADVNEADAFGLTPLHLAVLHPQPTALAALFSAKAKVNPKTKAMLDTTRPRDSRVLRPDGGMFFRPKTDAPIGPDREFDKGATPLHMAASLGDLEAVEILLRHKARSTMKDGVGATALHLAAAGGHASVVARLLEAKHDVAGVTTVRKSLRFYDQGVTPLMAALEGGNWDCIRAIAAAGADWHATTKFGCTTLFFAARGGCLEALEALHAAGVPIADTPARYSDFPLREAVAGGHHAIARRMLELGAATHESPNGSQAALRLAIERNDQPMRDLLLAGGATPLPDHGVHHAAGGNDVGYLERYAADGGDLDVLEHGMTPLMTAATKGHVAAVEALLAGGADPSLASGHGAALHYALANMHGDVVDRLLGAGADCSVVDEHGFNPLGRLVMTRLDTSERSARMLELGANPHSVTRHDGSVISFLRSAGQEARADRLAARSAEGATDASFVETTETLATATEDEPWRSVYQRLFDELVPPRGPARTQQGELVRCIGNLTDEAYRNGNINWSERHVGMVETLRETLLDGTLGEERWADLPRTIAKLLHHRSPDLSGDGSPHYVVSEAVVVWCLQHREPLDRTSG